MSTSLLPAEEALLATLDVTEVVSFLQALLRARSDFPPGETREQAMAEIRAALDELGKRMGPLRYRLDSAGDVAANINTPPADPFARAAAAALQSVCGERRDLTGYVQTSDGRWFADDGIPIIIFGPGDPALAHAANEFVTIDQLIEATRFLTLFAFRWLNKE